VHPGPQGHDGPRSTPAGGGGGASGGSTVGGGGGSTTTGSGGTDGTTEPPPTGGDGGGGDGTTTVPDPPDLPEVDPADPGGTVDDTLTKAEATAKCLEKVGVDSVLDLVLPSQKSEFENCMDGFGF
jgi:hypothetical protein